MSLNCILHVPHSSALIPDEERSSILLSDTDLDQELLQMTDWFTDELFAHVDGNVAVIRFPVSRLVVDPERFEEDSREPMSSKGMGVIYTRTSHGKRLRNDQEPDERQNVLDRYYRPHHERLTTAVKNCLTNHKQALIIDCHSFPSVPLPYEVDQGIRRPEICIGTDDYHTPKWLASYAKEMFSLAGISVEFNRPFRGALVPALFWRQNISVSSIMIEIRRDLYMDEKTGKRLGYFEKFAEKISGIVSNIIHQYTQ